MTPYVAATDDVSAVDDVAKFQEKIMTGLGEFYEELDDSSVRTYPKRATRHLLVFPEGKTPIYINGIANLKRCFNVSGNARKLAIDNYGETTREGVKIIAVPKRFVTKFKLTQYALRAIREGPRANAGTKKPYTPTKTSTDEN